MFDDWPKKSHFLCVWYIISISQEYGLKQHWQLRLNDVRINRTIEICLPAEIANTIVLIWLYLIGSSGIYFFPFMCHCSYFKPLWEENKHRIEASWVLGECMCQLNTQMYWVHVLRLDVLETEYRYSDMYSDWTNC